MSMPTATVQVFNSTSKSFTAELLRDMAPGETVVINGRSITHRDEYTYIDTGDNYTDRVRVREWAAAGMRCSSLLNAINEFTRSGNYSLPDGPL